MLSWSRKARFLYVQRIRGFDPPTLPHFDYETLIWFDTALRRSRFYMEFGSGGSTIIADKLGVRTISVEGDRFYGHAVRKALSPTTTVRMLTPDIGITGEWGWPLFRRAYKGRRYVSAPFAHMEGNFPDLVLIDGRYRVACALETARRAADAGATATLMLDDYEERPNYQVVEQYLGSPARVGKAAIFIVYKPLIPHEAVE